MATQSIADGWNALASRCELALSIQPSSAAVTIVWGCFPGVVGAAAAEKIGNEINRQPVNLVKEPSSRQVTQQ